MTTRSAQWLEAALHEWRALPMETEWLGREKLIAPQGARSRAIWVVTTDGGTSDRREGKGEES
jgi:hypothetical protein